MSPRERGRIGIIEDNTTMGDSLVQRLELEGYTPLWWQTGQEALEKLFTARPDLVVCDIVLPDISGEEVFLKALSRLGSTPFLFVTAHGKIDQAVRLTKAGAVEGLRRVRCLAGDAPDGAAFKARRRYRQLAADYR